ncbi:MAG: translation initiation factor IF-6 [Candidatus Altiarchaeota archaeon]
MYYQQIRVRGEDFIGLLGFATDRYVVLSHSFPEINVFKAPTLRMHVYGTTLVGMFCAGNSNGILFPYFVSDSEIKDALTFFKKHKIRVGRVDERFTALGNLISCNDHGAIVSPKLEDTKIISEVLGVDVERMPVGGHEESGVCLAATNTGFLAHPDAEGQLKEISEVLKVEGNVGSVNTGIPFVKSGLVANSEGYVTGMRTTGIELGRIDEALAFIR